MGVKVIGAGFGRTGTLSLKHALERLGFDKCYHMMEVYQNPGHRELWRGLQAGQPMDWEALFEGYQATVDWPSSNFWREQLAQWPDAKVILSRRDSDKWYTSIMNTIWKVTTENARLEHPDAQAATALAYEVIWDAVFDRRMDDKAHVIACYEAHNQAVIDEVPAHKRLVYEPGQGWEPLCTFLDVPVPAEDYPRVNTTEEFTARVRQQAAQATDRNR